ncbi:hypothetical protein KKJ04_22090, partial [Xenorhabdus bovienii]|nr:hypothetical protein [Xenorhabdus bovienii]
SSMWLCLCDCGNRVHVRRGNLLTGNTRSCGCLKSRHGHAKQRNHTPEYISWERAKRRCLDKNDMYYHLYGGRGITFCEHWLIFENFLKDMGERPVIRWIVSIIAVVMNQIIVDGQRLKSSLETGELIDGLKPLGKG